MWRSSPQKKCVGVHGMRARKGPSSAVRSAWSARGVLPPERAIVARPRARAAASSRPATSPAAARARAPGSGRTRTTRGRPVTLARRGRARSRLAPFPRKPLVEGHVVGASDDERDALMDRLGPEVEDPPGAGGRLPARLLDDEGQRRALVEEAELALLVLGVGGIEVDPALDEAPVDVDDQRAGVAERPRTAAGGGGAIRRRPPLPEPPPTGRTASGQVPRTH